MRQVIVHVLIFSLVCAMFGIFILGDLWPDVNEAQNKLGDSLSSKQIPPSY